MKTINQPVAGTTETYKVETIEETVRNIVLNQRTAGSTITEKTEVIDAGQE